MEPDFNFLEFKLRYETEDKFKKLCDFLAAQKDEDDHRRSGDRSDPVYLQVSTIFNIFGPLRYI